MRRSVIVGGLVSLIPLAGAAMGQDLASDAPPAQEPAGDDGAAALREAGPPSVGFFVEADGRLSLGADIDDLNGSVDVARLRGAAGVSFRLTDTADLILRMGSEASFYEFDNAAGIVPGSPAVDEPWDSVHATTFAPILRSMPETGWQWTLGGRVTSAGEPGADFSDTIAAGGFVLASYDVTDTLRLGAGVNIVTRLEGGLFVFPIPVIQWDVTDHLQIGTTERGFGATWFINPRWSAGVQVSFMRREYRLDDDNAVPGGSFTDIRVPVTLTVSYTPSPRFAVTGRIGSEVWGDLEINDRNENEVASYDLSSSVLVGVDLRLRF
jgi:hypothetical protein